MSSQPYFQIAHVEASPQSRSLVLVVVIAAVVVRVGVNEIAVPVHMLVNQIDAQQQIQVGEDVTGDALLFYGCQISGTQPGTSD